MILSKKGFRERKEFGNMKKIKEFFIKYQIKIGMIILLSILLLMVLKFGEDMEQNEAPEIGGETESGAVLVVDGPAWA